MMIENCWLEHGFLFGGPLGMIIGIVFWLFLAFGIFYFISHLYKHKSDNIFQKDTAMEILKRKYAMGEIDSQEFEKRKTIILS
jgi:putative membrane protein